MATPTCKTCGNSKIRLQMEIGLPRELKTLGFACLNCDTVTVAKGIPASESALRKLLAAEQKRIAEKEAALLTLKGMDAPEDLRQRTCVSCRGHSVTAFGNTFECQDCGTNWPIPKPFDITKSLPAKTIVQAVGVDELEKLHAVFVEQEAHCRSILGMLRGMFEGSDGERRVATEMFRVTEKVCNELQTCRIEVANTLAKIRGNDGR